VRSSQISSSRREFDVKAAAAASAAGAAGGGVQGLAQGGPPVLGSLRSGPSVRHSPSARQSTSAGGGSHGGGDGSGGGGGGGVFSPKSVARSEGFNDDTLVAPLGGQLSLGGQSGGGGGSSNAGVGRGGGGGGDDGYGNDSDGSGGVSRARGGNRDDGQPFTSLMAVSPHRSGEGGVPHQKGTPPSARHDALQVKRTHTGHAAPMRSM